MAMTILQYIKADAKKVPKTFGYKFEHHLLTIDDQEDAYKRSYWAYRFALEVPGADIRKYRFAFAVPGADVNKCMKAAGK